MFRDGVRSRLHCSTVDDLSMALVGTDSATRAAAAEQAALLARIPAGGARCPAHRFGGAGPLPGRRRRPTPTTSTGLHVWDWAAAALIATEAGAVLVFARAG